MLLLIAFLIAAHAGTAQTHDVSVRRIVESPRFKQATVFIDLLGGALLARARTPSSRFDNRAASQ